jgi:hypothetical protein
MCLPVGFFTLNLIIFYTRIDYIYLYVNAINYGLEQIYLTTLRTRRESLTKNWLKTLTD